MLRALLRYGAGCLAAPALALTPCPPASSVGPAEGYTGVTALPALQAEFVPRLNKLVRGDEVPGVAVAVIESGRVSWAQAFGWADRERKRPFAIDTPIPLGRWSELPLHHLAVRMAREGRLDLDRPVPELPPEMRWPGHPAPTLRQLLSHLGGLNGGRLHGLYGDPAQADPRPPGESHAVRPPGLLESYSLVGLKLAMQQLDESLRAEDSSLQQALADQLGQWLGPDCQRPSLMHGDAADLARGHRDGEVLPKMLAREPLALGLLGSLRGAVAIFAPFTLPDPGPDRAALLQVQNADAIYDFDRKLGLGLDLVDSQRPSVGRVALAFGAAPGFRAEARVALQHRLAVIVLANGNDEEQLGDIPGDLLDAVLEARLGIPRRNREAELPASVALPAGLQAAPFAARYATPFGRLRVESRFDEGLDFELFGRGFRARQRADGWYRLSYRLWGFIPLSFSIIEQTLLRSARHGEAQLLLAHVYGRTLLLGSAPSGQAPGATMDRWLGRYRLANPDLLTESLRVQRIELLREEGDLVLEYRLPTPFLLSLKPRVLLEAADPSHLRVAGIGPLLGERLRLIEDSDTGSREVEYAGYRFVRE